MYKYVKDWFYCDKIELSNDISNYKIDITKRPRRSVIMRHRPYAAITDTMAKKLIKFIPDATICVMSGMQPAMWSGDKRNITVLYALLPFNFNIFDKKDSKDLNYKKTMEKVNNLIKLIEKILYNFDGLFCEFVNGRNGKL